tara:strand:+ start:61 stop:459 length:399 start_codon:yes stop_codon:yes gene_type:complete
VEGQGYLDRCVSTFLKIKAERSRLKESFTTKDATLQKQQDLVKEELLKHLKENDLKSVKTDSGTFYRTVRTRYWTDDWEALHKFILEHGIPELLEKRLHQSSVTQFLEDNPELVPKGLNADSEFQVTIRKTK